MRQLTFESIANLPVVRDSERSFQEITGIALKLLPTGETSARHSLGPNENPLCCLVSGTPQGARACWRLEADVHRRAGEARAPQMVRCHAGLHLVTVPVIVEGAHIANWVTGQVLPKKPTEQDCDRIVRHLTSLNITRDEDEVRHAFNNSPIVTETQLEAMKRLLAAFSSLLAQHARTLHLTQDNAEPPYITRAKEYISAHLTEKLTLEQIATQANLSAFHFSRLFRKTTGQTLWQFVARLRVERAKAGLLNPFLRVTEIAHVVGFGSIAQFNAVFRRHTGMSPTEYRTARAQESKP